jgi:P-loop Domain of unknown function (DUF2791)
MGLSKRDIEHVFDRLRSGVVPERGLDTFAVGIERQRGELHRLLDMAKSGEGVFKFLRGGYGCGKTFLARLAALDAQDKNFATSFVVVSDNDLHFHRFDDVYRKVMQELGTAACPRGALPDIVDRWIGKLEDKLIDSGADQNAADFDERVAKEMNADLAARTHGAVPEDMARVLRAVFTLKQQGKPSEAAALLSWLSGSGNVAAEAKKAAGIKGEITSRDALDYLHGIVEMVKAAGYNGLVIVIDEAETILRMRTDVRGKSLNGIRQIIDVSGQFHGLLWVFTGTPDFFDNKRGVAGLQPLHDRIKFQFYGSEDKAPLKQPQLKLTPFDRDRLREVAVKLRQLYPTEKPEKRALLEQRVPPQFIEGLIAKVSSGLAGDVGVVPRQFLRTLVGIFDMVMDDPDFDPAKQMDIRLTELTEDELRKAKGQPPYDSEPDDDKGYPTINF